MCFVFNARERCSYFSRHLNQYQHCGKMLLLRYILFQLLILLFQYYFNYWVFNVCFNCSRTFVCLLIYLPNVYGHPTIENKTLCSKHHTNIHFKKPNKIQIDTFTQSEFKLINILVSTSKGKGLIFTAF